MTFPHFRTVSHDGRLITLQRIFDHPFFGWQVVNVIDRRGN